MRFEIENNILTIAIESPKTISGWQYSSIAIPSNFSEQRNDLISTFVDLCSGKAMKTQVSLWHTVIVPLFGFMAEKYLDLPPRNNDSEWTIFLVNYFIFYLTDTNSSSRSLKTRLNGWRNSSLLLSLLKERKMIPLHIPVPKLVERNQQVLFEGIRQNVVGQTSSISRSEPEHINEDCVNKLVLDLSYAKDNDAFLDDIEIDLKNRVKNIENICSEHWAAMKVVHQKGYKLISQISKDQLERVLAS